MMNTTVWASTTSEGLIWVVVTRHRLSPPRVTSVRCMIVHPSSINPHNMRSGDNRLVLSSRNLCPRLPKARQPLSTTMFPQPLSLHGLSSKFGNLAPHRRNRLLHLPLTLTTILPQRPESAECEAHTNILARRLRQAVLPLLRILTLSSPPTMSTEADPQCAIEAHPPTIALRLAVPPAGLLPLKAPAPPARL